MRRKCGDSVLELVLGDITQQRVEAIVNAANSALAGGGGVDGAIHRAAGPELMQHCRKLGGCPTGDARPTSAGRLEANWVIHAVGPVYRDGQQGEPEQLASAYRRSLEVADELGARSVAFPSLSTGAYRFPLEQAASIALATVSDYLGDAATGLALVRFVLFDQQTLEAFERALEHL
ncbi:MAG: O-acetyl-ADP-ribose deacetylase [Acidobacteriota bacterium]|nr:MAG: O-acetyl-ADP-ribose deacetylase [Acidobacteriota bacterium]